jgi:hypothetical protein
MLVRVAQVTFTPVRVVQALVGTGAPATAA